MPEATLTHRQPQVSGCPMNLAEVDLFSPGAQEYWFDAYKILHD